MISVDEPGIEVDVASWPVVVQRVGNRVGVEEMTAYTAELKKLFAKKRPFAAVVIVKKRGTLDFDTVKQYGRFAKEEVESLRAYYKGVAFVFPNDMFRVLLSAILAVMPAPVPYKVFADQGAAYDWAAEQLRAAGENVPTERPVLWP